jgi:(p)ppGpp synthase/HD superfamily hydrolase
MKALEQLLANLAQYDNSDGHALVIRAANFAERCHAGSFRLDGNPYILHSIAVAHILSEWLAPPEILAAALLHDVLREKYSHVPTLAALEAEFPPSLVSLVKDVTSLGKLGPSLIQKHVEIYAEQAYESSSQRFSWAMKLLQQDPMAVVIKLADRLHNLDRDALPEELRREKWFAAAILNIFAPLADRLGMYRVKEALEDGAFCMYNHERYASIDAARRDMLARVLIDDRISHLEQILRTRDIAAQVLARQRHRYAVFRRQLASATREITPSDILYIVVVVPSVEDCYRTLGVVHSTWSPRWGVYDSIAIPKANGYHALHTHTFEPSLGVISVVIRTEAMHLVADYGITAKWRGIDEGLLPRIDPLPERPEGYIMAITPKGEVKYLPRGATAIDFAYAIHEEMGHRCMQAWVNGNQVPLEAPLEDGKVVDVIVSRGVGGPSQEWLQHVVTDTAREAIKRWRRQQMYAKLLVEGADRIRILKDVVDCISTKGINILYVRGNVHVDKSTFDFDFGLHVIGLASLDDLEKELKAIPQITRVQIQITELIPQILPATGTLDRTATLPSIISRTPTPYALQPVAGHDFKGRDREVQDIVDRLRGRERDNPLLIWGQQRIGKTSLLWHLEQDTLPNETYLIAYVTLHSCLNQPIGNFLHRIALQIERKVQHDELKAPQPRKLRRNPISYFQSFIDRLEQVMGPQSLLIILDEFQGIGTLREENATRHDVFSYFRSLLQRGVSVNFLFCGGGIPERLLTQSGLSSLLSIVGPIKIDRLKEEDARKLITEPDTALHYEDQAIDKLLEITDCHPCYLKFLCNELYAMRTSQRIVLSDVERVIEQTIGWGPKLEGWIQHFWQMDLQDADLAKKNKYLLSAIASESSSSRWITLDTIVERTHAYLTKKELPGLLADLTDYGSIDKNGFSYHIHLPLLELWLQKVYPFSQYY